MPYTSDWVLTDECRCPICFGKVETIMWESDDGAHEDAKYRCLDCQHVWWIDGPDV